MIRVNLLDYEAYNVAALVRRAAWRHAGGNWKRKNPDHSKTDVYRSKRRRHSKLYRSRHPEKAKAARKEHQRKNPEMYEAINDKFRHTFKGIVTSMLSRARARSKEKRWLFDLDKAYVVGLWEKQNGLCYWFGTELVAKYGDVWKMSLDRLDGSKGYVKGNVVLASWFANRARGDMSPDEFMRAIDRIAAGREAGKAGR